VVGTIRGHEEFDVVDVFRGVALECSNKGSRDGKEDHEDEEAVSDNTDIAFGEVSGKPGVEVHDESSLTDREES
jgi:hypothetical protein